MVSPKLEVYVDVLRTLAAFGPLDAEGVAQKASVPNDQAALCLCLLMREGLVVRIEGGRGAVYATLRGVLALNHFSMSPKIPLPSINSQI